MIILDIEASGVDNGECGIWQIGAIELENPKNYFLEEGRIDDKDKVELGALKITGKTEPELRDSSKQVQKQMISNFLKWTKTCKEKIIVGQNVGWDIAFIQNKCRRYDLHDEFRKTIGYKGLDLYVIAQLKYFEKNKKYKVKENGKGNFDLTKVLEFCGIKDPRIELSGKEVINEGTPHNALEDCKLEGECYYRLMFGKNLFTEFTQDPIPDYLKK